MNRSFSEDSVDPLELEISENDVIIEQVCNVHFPTSRPQLCRVILTKPDLIIEESKTCENGKGIGEDIRDDESGSEFDILEERYPVEDIFGFHIVRRENEEPSIPSVYVGLVFYTKPGANGDDDDTPSTSSVRSRVVRVLEICEEGNSYQANLEIAKEWAEVIAQLVEAKCPNLYFMRSESPGFWQRPSIQDRIEEAFNILRSQDKVGDLKVIDFDFDKEKFSLVKSILFERKYLVVVNPVSGQGKSTNLLQDQILSILIDCGIRADVRQTEYSNHAQSLFSHIDLTGFDGIISVGGDGLLNEIVNGLRTRADANKYIDIPIGVIATGSGNGVARSIAAYCNVTDEEYKAEPVLQTTLSIARGCVVPVNLTEVTLDKRVFYSFLSVGWGLLADIDIESEVLRPIGELRFFIWSFIKLAKLRKYKATLSYIPHDIITGSTVKGRVIVDDEFVSVYSACQSFIGSDMLFAPDAKPNDNIIHLTYMPSNTGRLAAAKFLAELDRGQGHQLTVDPVKYVKVKEFTIRCEGGIEGCLAVDGEQVKGEEITVKVNDSPLLMLGIGPGYSA